jgi:uncharacterized membrane-anchored protein YhcB (DUF1043 family)
MAFEWPTWRRDLAAASVGFAVGSTLVCGGFVGAIRWQQEAEYRRLNEMHRELDQHRRQMNAEFLRDLERLPAKPEPPLW